MLIRTAMQDDDLRKNRTGTKQSRRKAVSMTAEPYHAGMSAYRRRTVQNKWESPAKIIDKW